MRGGAPLLLVILLGSLTFACRGSESLPPRRLPPDLNRRVLPKPPGGEDFAHRGFGYPLSVEDAEAILRQTEVFEFGGMPPKRQVQAFNVVFEQPDAIPRFQSIADEAGVAGRLYALAGLLVLDAKAADRVSASLSRGVRRILVIDSDTSYEKPVPELAAMVEQREMGMWFRRVRDETSDYFGKRAR